MLHTILTVRHVVCSETIFSLPCIILFSLLNAFLLLIIYPSVSDMTKTSYYKALIEQYYNNRAVAASVIIAHHTPLIAQLNTKKLGERF